MAKTRDELTTWLVNIVGLADRDVRHFYDEEFSLIMELLESSGEKQGNADFLRPENEIFKSAIQSFIESSGEKPPYSKVDVDALVEADEYLLRYGDEIKRNIHGALPAQSFDNAISFIKSALSKFPAKRDGEPK